MSENTGANIINNDNNINENNKNLSNNLNNKNISAFGWYIKAFKDWRNFQGRAGRKEFWYFMLFNFIISLLLIVIDFVLFNKLTRQLDNYGPFQIIYLSLSFIPAVSLIFRRLHDIGKSGWWFIVWFIIYIIFTIIYYNFVEEGSPAYVVPILLFDDLVFFIYSVILFIFYVKKSHSFTNKYGDIPK